MAARRRSDPLEGAIEVALHPGWSISWREGTEFVAGLEETVSRIEKLVATDAPRAVVLYEAFIAGCYEKAEEVDDSGGEFGQFVEGLFLAWIRARQAAGAAPDETVRALLRWIESDDYGYCSGLEHSAVKALDRKGRAAFEHEMRRRFEAAAGNAGDDDRRADYARRRWGSALKSLYAETKNVAAYAALCEQTDLTAEDCEIVVGILQARGKFQEALGWVERGLDIQKDKGRASAGGYKLPEMRRALLRRLGRGAEALESAWEQYQKEPNQFAYEELMRYVPRADKATWHARAMEASAQGDLSMVIDLWLKTKEIERLATHLRSTDDAQLEGLSHYVTEPAAKRLTRPHPDVAAKLYRALAIRILNAAKSKYYRAALSHLREARRCYQTAGLEGDWQTLVASVRERHRRKTGFMDGFERLLAGEPRPRDVAFLERARKRWSRPTPLQ